MRLEGAVDLVAEGLAVRAGFRVAETSGLAGGPIEVELFVSVTGERSLCLWAGGDRMRHRPSSVTFEATFAGVRLSDPKGHLPDLGGPSTFVDVTVERPVTQRLLLNQYVMLERTRDLLEPGASDELAVVCRRPLPLASDERAAITSISEAPLVEVPLTLALRRDDEALAALVDRLVDEVRHGPKEQREQPLRTLLALRAPFAVEGWRVLAEHLEPAVAERVREELHALSSSP